jgi:hypothetical protein
MKPVRYEPLSHSAYFALACFQCDLLSEHNITDRQTADGHETQSLLPATSFVQLANVYRGPGMDSVSLFCVATDDLEVALPSKLLPLCWRQPPTQEQQRPAIRGALGPMSDEKRSYSFQA